MDLQLHIGWPTARRPRAARAVAASNAVGAAALVALALVAAACATPTAPIEAPADDVADAGGYPGAVPTVFQESIGEAYPPARTGADAAERSAQLAERAGVEAVTVLDDWSAYASVDRLEDATDRNLGMGENTMDLTLVPAPDENEVAMVMAYDIGAAAPEDFVGFDRVLAGAPDWSGATAVALWVEANTDGPVDLVFQFREVTGEVWRGQVPLPQAGADMPLVLPLDGESFQWADWSPADNGAIDLGAIDQYGLYVGHGGPGRSGSVSFGPIVLLR